MECVTVRNYRSDLMDTMSKIERLIRHAIEQCPSVMTKAEWDRLNKMHREIKVMITLGDDELERVNDGDEV